MSLHLGCSKRLQMNGNENELPLKMASLDLCAEEDEDTSPPPLPDQHSNTYSLRKRPTESSRVATKRRCLLKPTKLNSMTEGASNNYLKKLRRPLKNLETIYEEPMVSKDGNIKYLGSSKPRKLQFHGITKAKMRHRKLKRKKVIGQKMRIKRKLNMEEFIARFHEIMKTKDFKRAEQKSDS